MIRTIGAAIVGAFVLVTSAAQAAIVVTTTRDPTPSTGAIFKEFDPQPTGTGVLNTFCVSEERRRGWFNTDWVPALMKNRSAHATFRWRMFRK